MKLSAIGPVSLYSEGLGSFIATLGIPIGLAIPFVALTVSAFAVTTLDTCTRLARFLLQESFHTTSKATCLEFFTNRFVATVITIILSFALLLTGQFSQLWPIFGSANTLLAAITLLAVSLWLININQKSLITIIPMGFMFVAAFSSLCLFSLKKIKGHEYTLAIISLILLGIALILIVSAINRIKILR